MIHDVSVWRIDGIYITRSDGIWVNTLIDQESGNLGDQPGRWHRPQQRCGAAGRPQELGHPCLKCGSRG